MGSSVLVKLSLVALLVLALQAPIVEAETCTGVDRDDCTKCLTAATCGWCGTESGKGKGTCKVLGKDFTCAATNEKVAAAKFGTCAVMMLLPKEDTCESCKTVKKQKWCSDKKCVAATCASSATEVVTCPVGCALKTTCDTCFGDKTCGWCGTTEAAGTCSTLNDKFVCAADKKVAAEKFGTCKALKALPGTDTCESCKTVKKQKWCSDKTCVALSATCKAPATDVATCPVGCALKTTCDTCFGDKTCGFCGANKDSGKCIMVTKDFKCDTNVALANFGTCAAMKKFPSTHTCLSCQAVKQAWCDIPAAGSTAASKSCVADGKACTTAKGTVKACTACGNFHFAALAVGVVSLAAMAF